MTEPFNGLSMSLGTLSRLSEAVTRSISAENPTGAKGRGGMARKGAGAIAARELGQGWKISPCITVPGRRTVTLADIEGPGAIQHFWLTVKPAAWRCLVLRFYWDGRRRLPSRCPPAIFCQRLVRALQYQLAAGGSQSGRGFNSYWEMPFRQHARVTVENLSPDEVTGFFYQIDYTLTDVPADRAYLHAQWRRNNPLPYLAVHTLLDGVRGQGHYVGTYLAWGSTTTAGGARGDQVLP